MFDLTNTTKIDYAGEVAARLNKDYARLFETVSDILARMAKLPKVIENEAHLSAYGSIMSEARETKKRLEAYHEAEKAPYLGGGRGVDNTFFSQVSKLARRKDGEPAGALDICDARVDNYMQAKLMEEQLKREAEAREAARVQRELEEAAAAAAAAAAEREAAAARARKPENIEAHKEAAYEHAEAAAKLEFQADHAAEVADDARIDTLATPADMTRTRLAGGQLATMAKTPVVVITDVTKLNKEVLWPFLKEEHILMALKAWAKTKSYKTQMDGATIKEVPKGQIKG